MRRPVQLQQASGELSPSLRAAFAEAYEAERRRLAALEDAAHGEDEVERRRLAALEAAHGADEADQGSAPAETRPRADPVSLLLGEWERLHQGALTIFSVERAPGRPGSYVARGRLVASAALVARRGAEAVREEVHGVWADAAGGTIFWGHGEVTLDAGSAGKSVITWRHKDGRQWQWIRRQLALPTPRSGGRRASGSSSLKAEGATAPPGSSSSAPAATPASASAPAAFAGGVREKALVILAGGIIEAFLGQRRASGWIPLSRTLAAARQLAQTGDVVGVALKLAEAEDAAAVQAMPAPDQVARRPRKLRLNATERRVRENVVLHLFADGEVVDWPRIRRLLLQTDSEP